ncbi:Stk1 family PASTA domain-containing Ser/Thr kinase [Actinomyces sp. oral taxon 180]|uniref:Stk1 family PASTA domain-containing Ser/Thr kinase n=1 Tax=Actinomyces sp. oral taxon 180 TaxID=651609 RepID=UPI0001F161FA|nr:Stk1 family PASTA domain-containing Ser/Thr kinase [Actinomyces sp. oral taxon 180]EFU60946.1 non-specific serine/threonine protein kinase [Actinomyces sp. oral taxon 180 str. F0310]
MAEPMAHRLAGRYEVRSLIGRGGMAEVHLGFDTRLSRVVAIKMLRRDLAQDSIFQARFRREAQSAASLNHPNIVAVYDTGEEIIEDAVGRSIAVPYIVMEYVEGHTVKDLISDGTAVPINEAVEIVSGVLSALDYSHANHLVHRDIKPGNIMLTSDGKIKVMDFGIARALTDSQATMTQTNAVVGTAQYLSPEQARGETVDARSDLYSTGVVLFELLTGRPPFKGDSAVAVAYQHVEQIPPTPSSILSDIPDSLDRVVLKALAKNREDRYPSAAAMLSDLQRVSRGLDVAAPPADSWATEVLPTSGMGGAQTAATTPMSAVAPRGGGQAMAATSTSLPPVAERADTAEEASKARKRRTVIIASVVAIALLLIAGSVWALTRRAAAPETVAVPTVVGLSQANAKAQIEAAGFVWELNSEKVASDSVEEGSVASTDPAGGTQAEKGSTVRVTISSGPDSVVLPDNLVGMTPEDARKAIEALGLKWELDSSKVASDTVAEGKVAQTNPSPGSKVKAGQTIRVYLSSGSDEVEVPDLSGMSQDQARSALKAVGLELGNVTSVDSEKDKDRIVAQDPATGTKVKKGATIGVSVSNGKTAQVEIPTVVGTSSEDAQAQLKALGLNVTVEEVTDNQPAGQVLSIEPGEGSKVEKNSTVKLKVSKGPQAGNNGNNGNKKKS